MKITKGMTCYYCGDNAVSSEHVPPRCFFPKDRRNSLIQVPACERHNESTSKDDSYVLFVIASFIGNNTTGVSHSVSKGMEQIKRSKALQSVLLENSRDVIANDGHSLTATKMIEIDRNRFDSEIKKMAYALYYHKYKKRWEKELNVGTNSLLYADGKVDEMGGLINFAKMLINNFGFDKTNSFEGSNQDVFKYRFIQTDADDTPILQMIFYEGFEVWVFVDLMKSKVR